MLNRVLFSAKVRRLYDIANVITTLGLIKKKTFLAANHRKMPGYVWRGPSMEEIDTVCELRERGRERERTERERHTLTPSHLLPGSILQLSVGRVIIRLLLPSSLVR